MCSRCHKGEASNVSVEIQGCMYKLCNKCFHDYLKVNSGSTDERILFIKGKLPSNSFSSQLWLRAKRVLSRFLKE